MTKAYIILAHKNVHQVKRLVDRLDDGSSVFYLHVDLRAPFDAFERIFRSASKVVIVERVKTEWAGFGLVKATLNAMEAIKSSGHDFERIILLSGQDYPIKSNAEIDLFFLRSEYRVFMEHYPLPNYSKWDDGGKFRIDKYFFGLEITKRLAAKTINFLGIIFPVLRRRPPGGMRAQAGSQWWTIDRDTLDLMLNFVRDNPAYVKFHKNTFAADEVFFQMILLNAQNAVQISRISNDNLRFMKWQSESIAHPEQLGAADLSLLIDSQALFARKFDEDMAPEILDLIDLSLRSA